MTTVSSDHKASRLSSPPDVHVNVLNLDARRRNALLAIDEAEFSWYHVKTCFVTGVGFFTDAYDLFAINIGSVMLGYLYGPGKSGLTHNQDLGLKVAAPIGTLIGQLLFGWMADRVGRKRMYGLELIVIVTATFAQALSAQGNAVSIIGVLIVWRFIMGIGIGGDYPLSAVITSEFAATRIRGRMMTAVFAFQGWGQFAAALIAVIITSAFKDALIDGALGDDSTLDRMWRVLIGLGCIPGVIAIYFRMTIPETPRYTMDIERNVSQAARDVETFFNDGTYEVDRDQTIIRSEVPRATIRDFCAHFGRWEKNGKTLFTLSWSWFALDIAFYGLGLNSSLILSAIGFGLTPTSGASTSNQLDIWRNLHNIAVGNVILSVAGLIPGYWVTFLFIDRVGRKPIQIMGFVMLTVIFCCMGFGYDAMVNNGHTGAFVALYCLANFFQNFGPNTTTFILPGEVFPTRYRSTAHGICAASGKLGAIIAQVGFSQLKDIGGSNAFLKHILEIFALFMASGIVSSCFIPETKGKSLEELSKELQHGFVAAGTVRSVRMIDRGV